MSDIRESELKMWLAVRADLELSHGKLATQAGHAYQLLTLRVLQEDREKLETYFQGAIPKITVRVDDLLQLERVIEACKASNIPYAEVVDAGRTEIEPGTKTVVAFGPAYREDLPSFLKRLRIL